MQEFSVSRESEVIESQVPSRGTAKRSRRVLGISLLLLLTTLAGGLLGGLLSEATAPGIGAGCVVGLVLGVAGLTGWLSSCNT
jgi:hypothetical protein